MEKNPAVVQGVALVNQLWLNEVMLALLEASDVPVEQKRLLQLGVEQSGCDLAARMEGMSQNASTREDFAKIYPRLEAARNLQNY